MFIQALGTLINAYTTSLALPNPSSKVLNDMVMLGHY